MALYFRRKLGWSVHATLLGRIFSAYGIALVIFFFNATPWWDAPALSYSSQGGPSTVVGEVCFRPPALLCSQYLQQ